jgi:hypothetical protein
LLDQVVEHLGHLPEGAGAVIRQPNLGVAALQLRERGQDHGHLIGMDDGLGFVRDDRLVHASPLFLIGTRGKN